MKTEKGKKAKDYCKNLLHDCKTWSGPCTSADELCMAIREHLQKRSIHCQN